MRIRASEAAAYRNQMMQAKRADAVKWRVPEDAEKPTLERHVRNTEQGNLGAALYLAAEDEVKKDWTRMGRAIMAGAPLPQYRQKDSLAIASSQGGGVKILEAGDGFIARLNVGADGQWIDVPVHPRTDRDEFRWPKLLEMARGQCRVTLGRVIFKLMSGKTLLQLTYPVKKIVKPVGERVATLSEFEDGRLLLRVENGGTLDFSSRLAHLKVLKARWDGLCRRFGHRANRRKGHARQLRRKLEQFGLERQFSTALHQWSAEMVRWLATQGAGQLACAHLIGNDWPAHRLQENLKYKCEDAGIALVEASLLQESTDRAISHAIKKHKRKAKKLGDALREVTHQLSKGDPS